MSRNRRWIEVLPIVIAGSMVAAPVQAAGLLQNADFTARAAAETGPPAAWELPPTEKVRWRVVDDDGHSGKDALRYQADAEEAVGPVTQAVACTPNTEYVLTAWLKSDETLRPLVRVLAADRDRARVTQVASDGSSTWASFSTRFNSGAAKQLVVEIYAAVEHADGKSAPAGTATVDDVQIYLAAEAPKEAAIAGGFLAQPPGENVARGRTYTLEPAPNYGYCTDKDDKTQLTDGEYSVGYFWVQPTTVGWVRAVPAVITVDLGQVEPIRGVSYNTAAGVAQVGWPMAVLILVSEDGQTYYQADDLIGLSAEHGLPAPDQYAVHRFWTDRLQTHGRYVKFVISPAGAYTFVDEIEVYRGEDAWTSQPYPSEPIADTAAFFQEMQVNAAVQKRLLTDLQTLRQKVQEVQLDDQAKQALTDELEEIQKEVTTLPSGVRRSLPPRRSRDFGTPEGQAVLPLNGLHERLFGVQAALWRAAGQPPLTAWGSGLWDPLEVMDPPGQTPARVEVAMMRNEYRAAAFNLSNADERAATVRLRIEGLPGGPNPDYVTVHEVPWTDTKEGIAVVAALPEAQRQDEDYLIHVPSGMTRQVWLTWHPVDVEPGDHRGQIVLRAPGQELTVPVRLRLFPFRFPDQPTLHLGGWDYTDGYVYNVTPDNRDLLIAHLREHFVDNPWATGGVMPSGEYDAAGNMVGEPDTTAFTAWLERWPGARRYAVFNSVGASFAGSDLGTPEFDRKVSAWISFWVDTLEGQGIEPGQLALLLVDEPTRPEQDEVILAWARVIQKAEPEVLVWEDPCHADPAGANQEMMAACDVLCPNRPMFLAAAQEFRDYYVRQREAGRELAFYSCSGPVRLLDPYSYHRLQHWSCWRYGARSSFYWAFGDSGGGSSWNEYASPGGPYTPLYLDATSVTAGKHLEAIREGIEDYEYLALLQKRIGELEQAGQTSPALEPAKKLLDTAASRVLDAPGADRLLWKDEKDRNVADQVRVEILETLAALAER